MNSPDHRETACLKAASYCSIEYGTVQEQFKAIPNRLPRQGSLYRRVGLVIPASSAVNTLATVARS